MPICGCSSAFCSASPHSPSPRSLPSRRRNCRCSKLLRNPLICINLGCPDLRLAVVSPFVDRRHGTERSLAELLERLAHDYHCEIHLYAQRIDDVVLDEKPARSKSDRASGPGTQERGAVLWHKVPSIQGPHLLQFL